MNDAMKRTAISQAEAGEGMRKLGDAARKAPWPANAGDRLRDRARRSFNPIRKWKLYRLARELERRVSERPQK